MELPPGLRFKPTEGELINFLYQKVMALLPAQPNADLITIPDLDLSDLHHPCMLNGRALKSGKKYYFFSRMAVCRRMKFGSWRELGMEEPVFNGGSEQVGLKKLLGFFEINGDQDENQEPNWLMEEYHLYHAGFNDNMKIWDCSTKWVLCEVHDRNDVDSQTHCDDSEDDESERLSYMDEMFLAIEDDGLGDLTSPDYD